jgi:transposase
MLTVDDYGQLRRAHRDGMSIRDIARTFHHSRRNVRQVLAQAQPRRRRAPPGPTWTAPPAP